MNPCEFEQLGYKIVGKPYPKIDSVQLLSGEPSYVDDFAPSDCLCIKLLRSPHANAIIEKIDITTALKIPGIVAIYTYLDVPKKRFTTAGQSYPEPSPHDRLILDQHVRYIGDPVAIIVGEDEKATEKAIRLIHVEYTILQSLLDFHNAIGNEIVVHPETDWSCAFQTGDNQQNLIHTEEHSRGDVEKILKRCDIQIEHTFRTKANHQGYMETMRAFCEIDSHGRLHCVSSTQIVFHTRRIIADALNIPKYMVHVEKRRVGGGFGAKQTVIAEIYTAFVTWKTKRPSKLIYTRTECLTAGSPRHEMEITVRLGASNNGTIRAIDMYTLSNGGAYGEHSTTTIGLSGHKNLPLYTANCEAARFKGDAVYTNVQSSGAYRGFGATQGCYALESMVNELAERLNMDPAVLRMKNCVREGMVMPEYFGETASACALEACIRVCSRQFGWEEKYPVRILDNGNIRSSGMAISMQGSAIAGCDVASCRLSLIDGGTYIMTIGAADIGTGCDTVLAQIAAEVLSCDVSDVLVLGADTDISPYDSGSYASSTTYLTGTATANAAQKLKDNICKIGANAFQLRPTDVSFDGKLIRSTILGDSRTLTLSEISYLSQYNNDISVEVTETFSSKVSPPPFIASMVEIEIDSLSGKVKVLDFHSVIDCGIPVNPNLARIQAEGGAVQGIGMALTENIHYTKTGKIAESNYLQYKIPTRADIGTIQVSFAASAEPTSAFGIKSIGEVTINTALPAICHAIARATGHWFRTPPFTPEKVLMALRNFEDIDCDERFVFRTQ